MVRRLVVVLLVVYAVLAASQCLAAGRYYLAFWREAGYHEKGGTGGMHVINVHVWDENGNPLPNKQITTNTGSLMGATDSNGQLELPMYVGNAYSLMVNDPGVASDITPGFSTTRAPDWGHYCFECGFIYRPVDDPTAISFDLNFDGVFNSSAGQPCELSAPRTRSLCFYSTRSDMGYYCSDRREVGAEAASVGQTFKATGNRIVECKVHVRGNNIQYVARIREGGPTGPYVGASAISRPTGEYEYLKTTTKWKINDVPVVPGNTYYLEITRLGGGTLSAYRVVNDNYAFGNYYEGGTAMPGYELEGHICCATVGVASTGSISGTVRDSQGSVIGGATVTASPGGYTATTAANGTYTIANVPVGTYSVTASKVGYQNATQTGKSVTAGGVTVVDFTLTAAGGGAITGTVKNSSGVGIGGASVITSPGGYSATTAGDGSYTISGVPAGTYDVTATASSYLPATSYAKTVTAGATTTVHFTLTSSFQGLKNGNFEGGFYNDPDVDHKVANDWHKFVSGGSPKYGQRYYDAGRVWTQSFYESAWTAGIYQQVLGATPGHRYTFKADVYGTGTVVSKYIGIDPKGGTNPASADVQWTAANTSSGSWQTITKQVTALNSTITVFVKGVNSAGVNNEMWIDNCSLTDDGPTTGSISGFVRTNAGAPIPGATITTSTGGYSATSAADGSYSIQNVTAGTYNITATASGWQSQIQSNKQVNPGATTPVNFNLTDASAPSTPVVTDDGLYTTTSTSLHASWSAADPQTGVTEYQYAIGTSPGATNVVGWTSTGTSTSVTRTGLALNTNQVYYISVKAKNADNMWSAVGTSDGIRPARTLATCRDAKDYADGECVRIAGKVVSARFGDGFYVQDAGRESGIRVTGASATEGSVVTVIGVLSTHHGERVISSAVLD